MIFVFMCVENINEHKSNFVANYFCEKDGHSKVRPNYFCEKDGHSKIERKELINLDLKPLLQDGITKNCPPCLIKCLFSAKHHGTCQKTCKKYQLYLKIFNRLKCNLVLKLFPLPSGNPLLKKCTFYD